MTLRGPFTRRPILTYNVRSEFRDSKTEIGGTVSNSVMTRCPCNLLGQGTVWHSTVKLFRTRIVLLLGMRAAVARSGHKPRATWKDDSGRRTGGNWLSFTCPQAEAVEG